MPPNRVDLVFYSFITSSFFTKGFYLYFFPLLIVVFKYQRVLIFLLLNLAIIILLKRSKISLKKLAIIILVTLLHYSR
jgi:hypothetical protein